MLSKGATQEVAVDIVSTESTEESAVIRRIMAQISDPQTQIAFTAEGNGLEREHPTQPIAVQPVPSWDPPPYLEGCYVTKYSTELFRAALSGDVEAVISTAKRVPQWLQTGITKGGETVLHIAAAAKHIQIVEALTKHEPRCLLCTNKDGSTPFCFAAVSGVVEIAKMMREHNNELPNIRGKQGMTPLHMAALLGHRAMVWYLLEVTDHDRLTDHDLIEILTSSIDTDLFGKQPFLFPSPNDSKEFVILYVSVLTTVALSLTDVALFILKSNLHLALARDARGETALHALARKPLKLRGYRPGIWRTLSVNCASKDEEPKEALELTYNLWNEVVQQKREDISVSIRQPWRLLFVAARLGKVEFLTVLIQLYPDLIWKVDENRYSIFHVAVINRQEKIFKLIYEIGAIGNLIATYKDENGNNMLHLAGKLAPLNRLSCVSGAALQMQRELQWFEAVKQIVRSEYMEAENKDKKTPQTLFSEEHELLRKQGEEWMKKTAESCALVAALIATMVFTAAFQLPGGFNSNTGTPVLAKKTSFVFFAMSNAVSLLTSTASILVFLSILTSRYAERDFLMSLPQKLMMGLVLLLISIATMVVSFTVTFFITFLEGLIWPPFSIAVLASVPVTLFALQQFPLLAEMYCSTYRSQNVFLPERKKLFQVHQSNVSAHEWRNPLHQSESQHRVYNSASYLSKEKPLTDSDIFTMVHSGPS